MIKLLTCVFETYCPPDIVSNVRNNSVWKVYQWTTTSLVLKSITYDEFLGFPDKNLDKLIVNRILNVNPRACRAVLARVV